MKKQLITGLLFFSFLIIRSQVYSPYYFLDTLKDKGLTSEIHKKFANKIYFNEWGSSENSGQVKDSDGNTLQFKKEHDIKAEIYLNRSLRFYYAKYMDDKNQKLTDWNYTTWKGNYFNNHEKNNARYVGYLLFVMTVNDDTACIWKSSVFEKKFEENTHFKINLWDNTNDNKNMGDDDGFWPLFSYIKTKKNEGDYVVKIDVYPGKLICKNVGDRGPDKLATGSIKFNLSKSDLDYLEKLPNKGHKLKFKDYDFENRLLWGVKQ